MGYISLPEIEFTAISYVKSGFVARITIDRPDAYNAYSTRSLVELAAAFRQAAFDDEVGVIVFTGAGDRAFCTGGDVKEYESVYTRSPHEYWKYMGLFSAYIDKVNLILGNQIKGGKQGVVLLTSVNLSDVGVFVAAMMGAMLAYFFSSLAIRAVGKTAQAIIVEVRRQFREMPGIMDYSERPDYSRVVDICTRDSLRELATPGLLAVLGHHAGSVPITKGWFSLSGIDGKGSAVAGFLIAVFVYGGWDGTLDVNEEVRHRRTNPGRAPFAVGTTGPILSIACAAARKKT